ncbi:hypothetical protein B0T22DRAFT_366662, partial [Podospora appendiculata]
TGKVLRPLNSYILYRMAYESCIRAYLRNSNVSQISVSQLCGESWRMETPSVRRRFEDLARIDNAKHKLAFPDYTFKR